MLKAQRLPGVFFPQPWEARVGLGLLLALPYGFLCIGGEGVGISCLSCQPFCRYLHGRFSSGWAAPSFLALFLGCLYLWFVVLRIPKLGEELAEAGSKDRTNQFLGVSQSKMFPAMIAINQKRSEL